jgi:hypothetical protein
MIKPDPLELPPAVARSFMADLKAYYAEANAIKRDEIAAASYMPLEPIKGRASASLDFPT